MRSIQQRPEHPSCGDCQSFLEYALRYYQSLLDQYGFVFVQCASEHDGRECLVMYENVQCRLLFMLSDGAEGVAIGAQDTAFPNVHTALPTNGETGWYYVVPLIEFFSGKKLLTRRLLDEFMDERRIYFEWESTLMSTWLDALMVKVAPPSQQTWHDDFSRYTQTQRYG